jgi:hypothetical protein
MALRPTAQLGLLSSRVPCPPRLVAPWRPEAGFQEPYEGIGQAPEQMPAIRDLRFDPADGFGVGLRAVVVHHYAGCGVLQPGG